MHSSLNRRHFLKLAAVGTLGGLVAPVARALSDDALRTSRAGAFDFVFFTDPHIQAELNAAKGCAQCFTKIASLKPEFAICGGDMVFDVAEVGKERAALLYSMYEKTEHLLQLPLHHAIGNHDVFGVMPKSGVTPATIGYGKKYFEDKVGATYHSFDHKGYHFIVLDSIHLLGNEHVWEARIDEPQLKWLADDLTRTGPTTPVIVTTHVPLVTACDSYRPERDLARSYFIVENAYDVLQLFEHHNVLAVLQGHTHLNECVTYKGTQFITSGAVSGNWWKGPRWGHAEGFTVVSLREGRLTTRYETYGFKSAVVA